MTVRVSLIAVGLAVAMAGPAVANPHDHHGSNHAGHDHSNHGTTSHDSGGAALQRNAAINTALAQGGSPVVADLLGVVCDFCAKSMDKTFGRRAEVSAVYVDLDTKTLNLVLKPGHNLSNSQIDDLVKNAGYRLSSIRRGASALQGSPQ